MSFQFELVDDGTPSIYETPTLFKKDSVGKVRTWRMQLDDTGRYRTLAGLRDGKQIETRWTTPVSASRPTVKEQGEFEVRAQVKHQLDREYRLTEAELENVSAEFIQPMLAKTYTTWPGPGYAQAKLDGLRCIATKSGLYSRQGKRFTAVPHIHHMLRPLFDQYPDLILDGELYNMDFKDDFGAIASICRKQNPTVDELAYAEKVMQYHVYDTVDPDSKFSDRSNRYHDLLQELGCGWIVPVASRLALNQEEADLYYGEAVADGYEGGMYRLDTPYEIGRRSKSLLKRKEFKTEEFPVVAIEEGNGNWAGAAKRMTLRLPDGREFGAGIRGSYEQGAHLLGATVYPGVSVATVRYFMLSPDGVPRFPVVVDYHMTGRQD